MPYQSLRGIPVWLSHMQRAIWDKAWHVWCHLVDLRSEPEPCERSAAVALSRPRGQLRGQTWCLEDKLPVVNAIIIICVLCFVVALEKTFLAYRLLLVLWNNFIVGAFNYKATCRKMVVPIATINVGHRHLILITFVATTRIWFGIRQPTSKHPTWKM